MTTTSTFQGMTSDGKPSSRVLNPPGGATSNIFGYDDQPQQQKRLNRENMDRGSDIFNQGPAAAAGPAAPKARGQRSGDDSFHNLFGSDTSTGLTNTHSKPKSASSLSRVESPDSSSSKRPTRRQHNSPDSFSNVFGEPNLSHRKMIRRVRNANDDSFSRVFGQSHNSSSESSVSRPRTPAAAVVSDSVSLHTSPSISHLDEVSPSASSSTISLASTSLNHSSSFRETTTEDEDITSSFSRVFGQYMADVKPSRSRKFSDKSAYNPITGESYEPKPTGVSTESSTWSVTSKEATAGSSPGDSVTSSSTETVTEQKSGSEEETPPQAPPAQTAAAAAPASQQRQQGLGVFGGESSDMQEHRSTRVSQPPGGRSTKLW